MNTCIPVYIEQFFKELTSSGRLRSDWLRQALFHVPRHHFIEQYYDSEEANGIVKINHEDLTHEQFAKIYSDTGLIIQRDPHSAASKPSLIFSMLDDLNLAQGLKVLEVGTGSGWNAGLIAFGVGDDSLVYSVDIQADLVEKAREHLKSVGYEHVNLRGGDGGHGWHGEIFDRIIITVGSPDIPPAWIESLTDSGILVMPLKTPGIGDPILRLHRQGNRLVGGFTQWAAFMNLQGDFNSPDKGWLDPGSDSVIDQLLQEYPEKALLPDVFTLDCAFWLYLKGKPMHLLSEYQGVPGMYPVLLDRELPALYVLYLGPVPRPENFMELYGSRQLVEEFVKEIEEWVNLGKPKMTDYHVELAVPGELADASYMWIDQRPNTAFRFSLQK